MLIDASHSWEQAVVAATVASVEQRHPRYYLGRTALQKLIYFIQILGVPLNYTFDIHNYGPFCSDLLSDLDWLQFGDIIKDESPEVRYSNFRTGNGWMTLKEDFTDRLDEHQESIDAVANAMGDMKPETLELIATLDFCFRWIHTAHPNGPWKELAIKKFKAIKKDKFPEEDIDYWYDQLESIRLIEVFVE